MNDLVWSLSHMLEDEMKGDQIVIYKISCQGCFLFLFKTQPNTAAAAITQQGKLINITII